MRTSIQSLLNEVSRRAARYLDGLEERAVAPTAEAVAALTRLGGELPMHGAEPHDIIALLDDLGSPATMAMAGPRFFGFVIGGSLPTALAANWLASAWDQNTAYFAPTPATAMLEEIARQWLLELLDLPRGSAAGFVTGATMANFTALAAARNAVLARAGWNVEADGLIGAPPLTIILGEEAHPTVFKSLGLLGFGRNRFVRVPADGQGRMNLAELPEVVGPTIICAQAGNVNTGAFDPIGALCERVRGTGVWVHVDGAFGLWGRASATLAGMTNGIELADSWATDAHKWLNVPYDSGLAFVREPDTLRAAMAITADYLPPAGEHRNPADYTPELSRRARSVDIWAALRSLGRSGVTELVDGSCRHARRFAEGLRAAGFEVLNDVVLNQVLVSFGDAERTNRVIAAVQADGTSWCGGTVWHGRTAMRISVSGWATTDEDVERSLRAIVTSAHTTT